MPTHFVRLCHYLCVTAYMHHILKTDYSNNYDVLYVYTFSFPHKTPQLLHKWIQNVNRQNWYPAQKSLLCSDHFLPEMLDRTGQTVRLRDGAIPTVFSHRIISQSSSDINELTKNYAVQYDYSYYKNAASETATDKSCSTMSTETTDTSRSAMSTEITISKHSHSLLRS